jgi:hypothetical protein
LDFHLRASGAAHLNLGAEVRFFGQGGASIYGYKPVIPLLDAALALPNLQVLYLNIGSNDIENIERSRLASALLSLSRYALVANDSLIVIIGQLHYRAGPSRAHFNSEVRQINFWLQRTILGIGDSRLHFAKIRGLNKSPEKFFCDGVHFTRQGQQLLARGVRSAITRALPLIPFGGRVALPAPTAPSRYRASRLSAVFTRDL